MEHWNGLNAGKHTHTHTHTRTKIRYYKKSIMQELKNFYVIQCWISFFKLMQCNKTVVSATNRFISTERYSSPFRRSSDVSMIK